MNKHIALLLLLIFTLASCEKDFVIKDQSLSEHMVINSLFSSSGKMNVYVTYSYTASGSNTVKSLDDAIVELYEYDVFKEQLHYVNSDTLGTFGKFQSSFNPIKGKKYAIKVSQNKYGKAEAADEQVIPVQILNSYVAYYPADSTDKNNARIKFAIRDDANKENYYKVSVWAEERVSRVINAQGDTAILSRTSSFKPKPTVFLTDTAREWTWNLFFSDNNFNGQDKDLEFELPGAIAKDQLISSKIWFEVLTVSKSYYSYYKTLELYRQTNNANSAEPSYVYSNINNGYGIFASYNSQRKSIVVK